MNYQILKSIIDSIVKNFKCEACSSSTIDWNIDIVWAAWNTLNLDVLCPNCWKHSIIRAEVSNINLGIVWDISNLKQNLINNLNNFDEINNKKTIPNFYNWVNINDKNIVDLSKKLKNNKLNVEDLLK